MGYKPVVGWGTLPVGWSFVEATAVAVDADDDVWVFNRGAHPVIGLEWGGAFKCSWGEGLIRRAHGITIGPDGTIWLTDDLHHTVRQFTAAGKLLLTLGDPDKPSSAHGGKPLTGPPTWRSRRAPATSTSPTATATRACTSTIRKAGC